MKIGARTLKTAIAVLLTLSFFELLKWDTPFYAAIAAVIGMQNTVENAYTVSVNRMIGTIIGGVMGFLLTITFGTSSLVCSIGVIMTISACQWMKKNNAVVISCIVLIAIMTNLGDRPAHVYAIHRVFETSIGLLISIAVNKWIQLERLPYFCVSNDT